jgi:amidase
MTNSLIWQDSWGSLRIGPRRIAAGNPAGPLRPLAFVVDDLIDVKGTVTGSGNARWLASTAPAAESAAVVATLIDAGATCVGKSHVDEFGLSLRDARLHSTVVRNPAAPQRDAAGASRGAAAAVAAGIVPLALGRDTGGSLSIAAAACGLVAIRPTPARVDAAGVLPVAPAFDAVGWTTKTLDLAVQIGHRLLGASGVPAPRRAIDSILMIDPATLGGDQRLGVLTAERVREQAARAGLRVGRLELRNRDVDELIALYRDVHVAQTWRLIGGWAQANAFALSSTTAVALRRGAGLSSADVTRAQRRLRSLGQKILRQLVEADAVLAMPAASELPALLSDAAPAPAADSPGPARPARLANALGMAGVTLPLGRMDGAPIGVGLWAAPGADESLWELARTFDAAAPAPVLGRADLIGAC